MPTLLTSTGYGNTGSSAATNILEEFELVKSFGNAEFTFAHEPDGIADLENSLLEGHRLKTDLAVKRFLKLSQDLSADYNYRNCFNGKFEKITKEYIKSVIPCDWDGWWHRSDETEYLSERQKKKIKILRELYSLYLRDNTSYGLYEPDNWQPTYCPLSKEYYANLHSLELKNDFLKKTRNFTDKLLKETGVKDSKYKYILLDQAVPPISFSRYLRYFTSPKVIIVDREPRDLYVMNKVFWGSAYVPTNDIHIFIKWYSQTRQSRKNDLSDLNKIESGEVLFMQFESFIYEYDSSVKKIINYTGLSSNEHKYKLKHFNPDLSIKNTQVFVNYPELQNDIKLIEQNLGEYCYNFPYTKDKTEKKEEKYFFMDEINQKFHKMKKSSKLLKGTRKYFLNIIYKYTRFYRNTHDPNLRINLFSSIKIFLKLILCPFELLYYYLKYF